MTAKELSSLIGRVGHIRYSGNSTMTVEIVVADSKQAYGNTRVRVEPVCGNGHAWVDLNSVTLYREVE